MNYINKIPLDYEVRKKAEEYITDGIFGTEMTEFESAFLSGLIKWKKPKKIVEVGVAGGGSTAVMLQALEETSISYRMYSVDTSIGYYRNGNGNETKTGFLANGLKNNIKNGQHEFLLGNVLPAFIDMIGDDIDFVLLDTMHILPGELLDFLAIYPHLSNTAVICLHDIALNQYARDSRSSIATNVLFHSVFGNKILNLISKENSVNVLFPNIGAFQLNESTFESMVNVFLALTLNWKYMPLIQQFDAYTREIKKCYSDDLCAIYFEALKMNMHHLYKLNLEGIKEGSRVILYGAGWVGRAYYQQIISMGKIEVVQWVDKAYERYTMWQDYEISSPIAIGHHTFDYIIIAIGSRATANQVREYLYKKGIPLNKLIWPGDAIWEFSRE